MVYPPILTVDQHCTAWLDALATCIVNKLGPGGCADHKGVFGALGVHEVDHWLAVAAL